MAVTRTPKAGLTYPGSVADQNWNQPLTTTFGILDGMIGGLAVSAASIGGAPDYGPSGLNVSVASGTFVDADGLAVSYAGTASYGMTPSTTNRIWLTPTGTLGSGAGWPTTPHVKLATVVAGATDITSITDERLAYTIEGPGVLALSGAATLGAGTRVVTCDATGGAFAVTLPTAVGISGRTYRIKKIDATVNGVTVTAAGLEMIEGSGTFVLSVQWDGVSLVSDGTRWLIF